MKKSDSNLVRHWLLAGSLLFGFAIVGCGPGSESTNVAADADAEAMAEYERLNSEGDAAFGSNYKP